MTFEIERPSKQMLERLRKIPTSSISDALDKIGFKNFMSCEIRPRIEGKKIVGPAITARDVLTTRAIPPIPILEAIDNAKRGDIIVRSVDGDARDIGLWGGLMATAAKARGLEGAVLNGGLRDIVEIKALGFQIFSRSLIPSTSVGRTEISSINVPIDCGGVLVHPGDIIVGDDDGVVVIPKEKLEAIIMVAEKIDEVERAEVEELKKGNSIVETIKKYARV